MCLIHFVLHIYLIFLNSIKKKKQSEYMYINIEFTKSIFGKVLIFLLFNNFYFNF